MWRFSLVLLTGCIGLIPQLAAQTSGGSTGAAGPMTASSHYWGPDCERIGAPKNIRRYRGEIEPSMGKQPNLASDQADQILRLVCVDQILSSYDEPDRDTWVVQHFRFDEIAFDHVTAAMMLVQCLEATSCLAESHHAVGGRKIWQDYETGMMRWYADRVDANEVAKRLALVPIPVEARAAFLALLDRARASVIQVSDGLSPEAKQLFVELPASVHARREAELAKQHDVVDKLLALTERVKSERAQGVGDDTLEQLRALRATYHAGCKADCTRGLVFAAITRQLFWAYVSRNDSPGAMAESKLLAHLDPSAAMEIATKQSDAIGAARGRTARVAAARQQGIDADTARVLAPAAPGHGGNLLDLGDGRYVYRFARDMDIDYAALVPDKVGQAGGKVAAVDKRGTIAVVRFADDVSSWTEGTNCYETNRIDGIDSNGKLIYREACAGEATHVERHAVPPITVPAGEASALRPGDEVVAFVKSDRSGRIWMVKHGDKVVRLRDMAL